MNHFQSPRRSRVPGWVGWQAIVLVLAVVTLAFSPGEVTVQGAKPQYDTRASMKVSFSDPDESGKPVYGLRSDGQGDYVDKFDGTIWIDRASDKGFRAVLDQGRRFHAWLPDVYRVSDLGAPAGFSSDGWFIYIPNIGDMAMGQSRETTAVFNVDGEGGQLFPGSRRSFKRYRWGEEPNGGITTQVTVTRTDTVDDRPQWVVTPRGEDPAFLQEIIKGKYQYQGHYLMPFQLTIDCIDVAKCAQFN